MRFPSLNRLCLEKSLKEIFPNLPKGDVLYIGVGEEMRRYKKMIPHDGFGTLDINRKTKPTAVGDIHNIPTENNCFDTVIVLQVLEYCHNPQKAIDEVYRVLKPGGLAVIATPFMHPHHNLKNDYYRFTENALADMAKKFRSIRIISNGNKFLAIYHMLSKGKFSSFFHLLNPLLVHFDSGKRTRFALNYIMVAEK